MTVTPHPVTGLTRGRYERTGPTEREVQARVKETYEAVGCLVANFSQGYRPGGKRHGTTRQTKGIPDLYVFPPLATRPMLTRSGIPVVAGYVDDALPEVVLQPFWHETKRPGGKQSPEQARWQHACDARGVGYVLGGVDEALAHLRRIGLVGR